MTKSLILLVDLDDTLLVNPVKNFMKGYLDLLSRYLSPYVKADLMIPQLLRSTGRMIEKQTPYQTLEEVFDADFYKSLSIPQKAVKASIDQFYGVEFPALKTSTMPQPGAVEMIKHAFSRGYQIVIATNPLFPRIATLQRLSWAGLSADQYPFDLITTYEFMHFAKPSSAYYAEILGQLGWPQQPVCMVGNSLEFDIIPTSKLGIPGYLLLNQQDADQHDPPQGIVAGSIDGLIPWMDSLSARGNSPEFDEIDAVLSILKSTPGALISLTRNLTLTQWKRQLPGFDTNIAEFISRILFTEKENNLFFQEMTNSTIDPSLEEKIVILCDEEIQNNAVYPMQELIDYYISRSLLWEKLAQLVPEMESDITDRPADGNRNIQNLIRQIASNDRIFLHQIHQMVESIAELS